MNGGKRTIVGFLPFALAVMLAFSLSFPTGARTAELSIDPDDLLGPPIDANNDECGEFSGEASNNEAVLTCRILRSSSAGKYARKLTAEEARKVAAAVQRLRATIIAAYGNKEPSGHIESAATKDDALCKGLTGYTCRDVLYRPGLQ